MKEKLRNLYDKLMVKFYTFMLSSTPAPSPAANPSAENGEPAPAPGPKKKSVPWVSILFIAISIIIPTVDCIMSSAAGNGFIPGTLFDTLSGNNKAIIQGETWRILSAPLVVSEFWSAILTAIIFIGWGFWVEEMVGHWKCAVAVIASVLIGNFANAMFRGQDFVFSGLLPGTMGLLSTLLATAKYDRRIIFNPRVWLLWMLLCGGILGGIFSSQNDFLGVAFSLVGSVTIGVAMSALVYKDKSNAINGLKIYFIIALNIALIGALVRVTK